jgi:hypothetical protein
MSTSIEAPRDAVVARLDHMLQRARIVKPTATIDPPLQVSELVPEDEPLLEDLEGEKEARWLAVDSAAKSVFYAYLVSTRLPPSIPQLTCPGIHKNRRTRLRSHLEPSGHTPILWRSRYRYLQVWVAQS